KNKPPIGSNAWIAAIGARPINPSSTPGSQKLLRTRLRCGVSTAPGVLLIAVVGAGATYLVPKPTEKTFATEVGGRKTLELPDGSRIELNTGTVLRLA